ncbi:hypothetical protein GQ600_3514 [Phytophthora cactorum]|nr:hypothetical protein GQ600_3514 [Phytophthora cactorum]
MPKELYIPGQVTHIFFYKGSTKPFTSTAMQQNMLSDHLGCNYLSALRVVRDARRAKPTLPEGTKTRACAAIRRSRGTRRPLVRLSRTETSIADAAVPSYAKAAPRSSSLSRLVSTYRFVSAIAATTRLK